MLLHYLGKLTIKNFACGRKRKKIVSLVASNFVIHPQILIVSVWRHRGSRAHALNVFECAVIRVTREIDDFRQNFGIFFVRKWAKVQLPKFYPLSPLGIPV